MDRADQDKSSSTSIFKVLVTSRTCSPNVLLAPYLSWRAWSPRLSSTDLLRDSPPQMQVLTFQSFALRLEGLLHDLLAPDLLGGLPHPRT